MDIVDDTREPFFLFSGVKDVCFIFKMIGHKHDQIGKQAVEIAHAAQFKAFVIQTVIVSEIQTYTDHF